MTISRQLWFFLLLCCLEFIFIIGPILYYKFVQKENIRTSLFAKFVPSKRTPLARLGDVGAGISVGVFLSFLATGLLYTTYYSIIGLFGEDFYNTASSGSIDVVPDTLSIAEVIIIIFINFFIIGVCEEYFFRGVLFLELKKYVKNWSYLINGIVFSLYHVFPGVVPIQTTVTYFLYYFILGILLCVLFDSQNNDLISNVIAHGVFNSIPLILSLFS